MRTKVEILGIENLQKKLEKLAAALPHRKQAESLAEAGELVAQEMRELAPVDTGRLRESIGVTVEDGLVSVGPTKPDAWYAHFLEFGTVEMAPRPFITPAFDHTQQQMEERIAKGISAEIRKSVAG